MLYYDPNRKRWALSGRPIADTRARLANWRKFKSATGYWPYTSIAALVMRYVLVLAIAGVAGWYGLQRDWSVGDFFLVVIAAGAPTMFVWFMVERIAWTHDLREKRLISEKEVWGFDHFPADKFPLLSNSADN